MKLFQVAVTVSNPTEPSRSFTADFWVDTGALYSVVPAGRLREIGIEEIGERNLVLADGGARKMKIGSAAFQIRGNHEKLPCTVVFAPEASLYFLGATTLENFGVDADPVEKRLKPILAIMGGFLASR